MKKILQIRDRIFLYLPSTKLFFFRVLTIVFVMVVDRRNVDVMNYELILCHNFGRPSPLQEYLYEWFQNQFFGGGDKSITRKKGLHWQINQCMKMCSKAL